jgi:hypothetical protein
MFHEITNHIKHAQEPVILADKTTTIRIAQTVSRLSTNDQEEILKAAQSPYVIGCIKQLNAMFEHSHS